ncbi:ATP-binding protein [Formosa sp. PL04]|uniref:hybrid sensor histidine kinase/response regulator transcription factor n=1 Tax=Formosa sp. PL04 TaxID=3081755 RepID=UPI002980D8AD|nr:ATP-binding protein [Formosa sp. PL04]MDW5288104.1 ATP-binding protein [Formosa sp. PL04]
MFKKNYLLNYLLIIAILFSFQGLVAQEGILKYSQKLSISDGLAHNGVTSVLEDSKGFLWFGTYDGINKYDGYQVKTFKNTIDENILTSNRIREIAEDTNGNLWLGTDQGITIFNYSEEKFEKIDLNSQIGLKNNGLIVRKILFNKQLDLVLCATEGSGILVFNKDNTFEKQFVPSVKEFGEHIQFFDGILLNDDTYLFTTSVGVLTFNIKTHKYQKVVTDEINYSNSVSKLGEDRLLITLLEGVAIIKYNLISEAFSFEIQQKNLESYQFNSSSIDNTGKIWLGTLNDGLFQISEIELRNNEPLNTFKTFKDNNKVLRISCIVFTKDNNCWVGTFNKGLFKFEIDENPFKSYHTKMDYPFGMRTNNVTHIVPFDSNRVFLVTNFGGLSLFNTVTEQFEEVPLNLSASQILNISALYIDSKENIWFRFHREKELCRIKKGSSTIDKIELENLSKSDYLGIRSFTEDKQGNIWLGLNTDVYKISISKSNDIVKVESLNNNPFFKNNKLALARFVYADPLYDFIWIGADSDGLFRVNYKNNKSIDDVKVDRYVKDKNNPLSISSNFVTTIVRLPNEELWIGTEGGGICKVINSNVNPEFIAFTEKNGLSNNVVKSILYDDEYNLFVATNIGLNRFNTKENSFRKFNDSDGLPFEDFWFAAKKLKNNVMLFSGLDGLCYFNPKNIKNNEELPELEFENFKLFNKIILSGDTINNRILLKTSLTDVDEIELNFDENSFSLDLTSLHFSNPENHQLKYQLTPISKDWTVVPSSQKTIYYNALPPGEYTLSVMASNSLNEWTVPKQLKINISPPFWKTILAYVLYAVLVAFVIFIVVYINLKIQSLKHKVVIEQLEFDNVKQVNEAKLRFFSNISHEIKTPLTLISGPIEVLIERFKGNEDVNQKLFLMQRQSKKIQQLIDQVHDFQRSDANLLKMNYTEFCVDTLLQNIMFDFDFMAKKEHRILQLKAPEHKIFVSADSDKLEKILNNLLNNAFKYTKKDDEITVSYKQSDNNLIIEVSDTGKGIDSEDLPHIFERFYQSHKKHSSYTGGSGIGLAFSKRLVDMHYGYINAESIFQNGSTFTVSLPVIIKDFDESLITLDQQILLKESTDTHEKLVSENVNIESIKVDDEFTNARIFFAEDNFDMRNFVSAALSNFFDVKTFTNGMECSQALNKEWPDLVISDVLMPEMNGFELCKHLKTDIKTSHIPIILLTACTTIDDQIHGINDGADAYIKKPFNMQHLVSNIEALLRNRKQLRERFKNDFPLSLERNDDTTKDNAFLEKLYSLMAQNLDNQDLDLNTFARELYLNRTHFYQKVKVLTNQTPFELLKMYRLNKAAEFLIQKKLSVNEVFTMTGFKSRTHFAKLFKEKFNCTPGKYAAKKKKEFDS